MNLLIRRRELSIRKSQLPKKNIFIVTESTRKFNNPNGRQRFATDVIGDTKEGSNYHITGLLKVNVINTSSSVRIRIGKWNTFMIFDKSNITLGKHEFVIDTVVRCGSNQNGGVLLEFDCNNLDGTATITNMYAEEV